MKTIRLRTSTTILTVACLVVLSGCASVKEMRVQNVLHARIHERGHCGAGAHRGSRPSRYYSWSECPSCKVGPMRTRRNPPTDDNPGDLEVAGAADPGTSDRPGAAGLTGLVVGRTLPSLPGRPRQAPGGLKKLPGPGLHGPV